MPPQYYFINLMCRRIMCARISSSDDAVQRYVNILTNSGFKAVFGDRDNKDVVMSVINALLPDGRQVSDIEYCPTEHEGPLVSSKEFRYDFMCRDAAGTSFIVEVQCYPDRYWFRRCVSYASRAYDRQNRIGGEYDLQPVYLIGLMGTPIVHQDEELWGDRYVSEYVFMEKFSHELQDETIVIIFAELSRFDRQVNDCRDDVERMLYVLKNMGHLHNQPRQLCQEIYTRIFRACEIAQFDEAKRIQYEKDMFDERAYRSELSTARADGLEEGLEQGLEQGRAEGRAEGHRAILEMARKLLAKGMSVSEVAQLTSLSQEEISELQ